MTVDPEALAQAMLALAAAREGHSISPTEVAQAVATDPAWHTLMPAVRRVAVKLALEGRLVITRKGKPVDPTDFKGVYRLSLPRYD